MTMVITKLKVNSKIKKKLWKKIFSTSE